MEILSPVTESRHTSVVLEIPSNTIIDQYKHLGIDVTRFLKDVPVVQLLRCNDTGYRFYYPFSIFGDGAFYDDLQTNLKGYYVEGRKEHLKALEIIKPSDKVLEIGSGSGYFLGLLKEKQVDCRGLEFNPQALADATAKGLTVYNETLEHHAQSHAGAYDIVCSFQVLEHITDIKSYFDSALKALKPGGKLLIGVPNNNPYIFKHDIYHTLNLPPHHAGLWNRATFEKIPSFFPVTTSEIYVEPLQEIKEWYKVQINHYRQQNKTGIARLLQLVPRPVYKLFLKVFSSFIGGRNVVAVFVKK